MEKPIIALSLAGVFLSSKPWKEAHRIGMRELAEKAGMPGMAEDEHSKDYFEKVEKALSVIYPDLSPEDRRIKRRKVYFKRVLDLIKKEPKKNEGLIDLLFELKERHRVALITTTLEDVTMEILNILDIKDLFDIIEASNPEERDDKESVLDRFIENHGKPDVFVGGSKSEDICEEKGIKFVEFDCDNNSLEELRNAMEGLEDGN